jgi:hypothetical protein
MSLVRAQESKSWDPPGDLDLNDQAIVALWTRRLQVTPRELEEVIDRVNLGAMADAHRPEN